MLHIAADDTLHHGRYIWRGRGTTRLDEPFDVPRFKELTHIRHSDLVVTALDC